MSQTTRDLHQEIETLLREHDVVLFMKGTPQFPQCGFSATAAKLLAKNGVTQFKSVNVLEDPEMREAIKVYSNWPTLPQLYIRGEFIGGCDIMREMDADGSLARKLRG
ncbi:MAG: Grx4 family monothiol glutaredoxin [Casimicrobiaceae bacterium]|nr:Grx4 family monothiol glutaredoxin [Casimicrobiaceae bacterium]MCX8098325.1 Grx4 family monothiol glutaredoxin [Casimicrobiaceae bacterium]MDW8311739.1 Grx4 family monothiol glutaredoxin [Burkholderiales bacterium]